MRDLLERPMEDIQATGSSFFGGYRGPANPEPQQHLPGFFDAELSELMRGLGNLGSKVTDLALRAPGAVFGWFFESERPWWPESKS